jgi:hypothetical protein
MIYEHIPEGMADPAITEAELWADAEGAASGSRPAPESLAAAPWLLRPAAVGTLGHRDANDDRMALVCLLIHAARALAAAQITIANGYDQIAICAACGEQTVAGMPAQHRPTCLAAEVTAIVGRLRESLNENPQRKENASAEEIASAGDGNRSRIAYREPWNHSRCSQPGEE